MSARSLLGNYTGYGVTARSANPRSALVAPVSDYDYDGYVSKYGEPDQSKGQHLTDEFKLPNHITFSDQSKYHNDQQQGGRWSGNDVDGWLYTPSSFVLSQHGPEKLAEYFSTRERKNTAVILPDGRMVYGSK